MSIKTWNLAIHLLCVNTYFSSCASTKYKMIKLQKPPPGIILRKLGKPPHPYPAPMQKPPSADSVYFLQCKPSTGQGSWVKPWAESAEHWHSGVVFTMDPTVESGLLQQECLMGRSQQQRDHFGVDLDIFPLKRRKAMQHIVFSGSYLYITPESWYPWIPERYLGLPT